MNQQCVFGVRCSFLRKCNETSAHDIVNLSAMYRLMNQTEGEQPQAEAGKLKDNMLNMLDVDPDDNGAGGAGAEDLEHPLHLDPKVLATSEHALVAYRQFLSQLLKAPTVCQGCLYSKNLPQPQNTL